MSILIQMTQCLARTFLYLSHSPTNAPELRCKIFPNSSVPISQTIHLVSWRRRRDSTFLLSLIRSSMTGKTTSTSDAHWAITVRPSTLFTSRTLGLTRWLVHSYVPLECSDCHSHLRTFYRTRTSFLFMLRLSAVSRTSQNPHLRLSLPLAPVLIPVFRSAPLPRQRHPREQAQSCSRDYIGSNKAGYSLVGVGKTDGCHSTHRLSSFIVNA